MYKLIPVFSEKIWGSNRISKLGFDVDPNKKIGEAWIASGYHGNSTIVEGLDITLEELYKTRKELFNDYHTEQFPLLVKILDANDDLSVQVHPDNKRAMELEQYPFGKTECWVVLDTKENNTIIDGINTSSQIDAEEMIHRGEWDKLLRHTPINKGDVFDISAGTVHAIKAGTLIYELQQSSDITYRLYDYDRYEDGKPRELHIEKSIASIDFHNRKPCKIYRKPHLVDGFVNHTLETLIDNDLFLLQEFESLTDQKIKIDKTKDDNFLLITNIGNDSLINDVPFKKYDTIFVPVNEIDEVYIEGKTTVLIANPK